MTDSSTKSPSSLMEVFLSVKKKIARLKQKPCWYLFTKVVMFIIHFVVVMLLLFCGAVALARLEDPDIISSDKSRQLHKQSINTTSATTTCCSDKNNHQNNNETMFWAYIEAKYKIILQNFSREEFLKDVATFEDLRRSLEEKQEEKDGHHKHTKRRQVRDKKFLFMKWFHFVIIATTTIGYGHVYPKTDNGKLFYIVFSVFGIVLMMTLLRSCGKIIMSANKEFYMLIRRRFIGGKECVSGQLMSIVFMCFTFLIFMVLVLWHDKYISEVRNWSCTDTFYFWLVTFTTVGFGDVHFPLEVEIEHFYELVVYRVFGLSFLAGIIESIHEYIKYRKSLLLMKHNRQRIRRKVTGQKRRRKSYIRFSLRGSTNF